MRKRREMKVFLFGGTRQGGGGVAPPVLGPYLPTVASNPLAVWGNKRMWSGYNGTIFTLRELSGNTTSPFAGGTTTDNPSYSAITTFANGAALSTLSRTDQFGTGHTEAAASTAVEPLFDVAQNPTGCVPCKFNGDRLDCTIALSSRNITVFQVLQVNSCLDTNQGFWTNLSGGAGGTIAAGHYYGNAITSEVFSTADGNNDIGAGNRGAYALRSNLIVVALTCSASEIRLYSQGTSVASGSPLSAVTGDTFSDGMFDFSGGWFGHHRNWATVIYPALSQADVATVIASLVAMYSVPVAFTGRSVFGGDSIMASKPQVCTDLNNISYFVSVAKPTLEIFNVGVGSLQLSECLSAAASTTDLLITSAYGAGMCVLLQEASTNDLGPGNAKLATTVYSSLSAYVTEAQGLGYKYVAVPTLPRADASWTGLMETQRGLFNTSVASNLAGADAVISSNSSNPSYAATATSNPAIIGPDFLHWVGTGYGTIGLLANQYVAALTGLGL